MEERDSPAPILIGFLAAFSWHLGSESEVIAIALYVILLTVAVIYTSNINGNKPFMAAGHISFGVLLGTVVDLVLLPTVDGFERNLWPIELVMAPIMALIVSCAIAGFVSVYFSNKR